MMTGYSLQDSSYKQMYLINKFEKDILEKYFNNMNKEKNALKSILKSPNFISQETQTKTTEKENEKHVIPELPSNISDSKEIMEEVKNSPTNDNSTNNIENKNKSTETRKKLSLDKKSKGKRQIGTNLSYANWSVPQRMRTRQMSQKMSTPINYSHRKSSSNNKSHNNAKEKHLQKSPSTLDIDNDGVHFHGWKP